MSFEPGDIVGDYQITGVLGAGGMGRVFRVRNLISDREEAMKLVHPSLAAEPEILDRFLREIKVQASLEHPNIAALHTAFRSGNSIAMILELIEGESLHQRLQRALLSWQEAIHYFDQVLSGLAFAHRRGIVHRDIKPANLMLTPSGIAKVTDFGIARAGAGSTLTSTGRALGSLLYMAPEQVQGLAVDGRSDLYSLSATLYESITGVKPFRGENEWAILQAHLNTDPVPPAELQTACPAVLSDSIMKALRKEPADRYDDALAFQQALRACRDDSWSVESIPVAAVTPEATDPSPSDLKAVETALARIVGPIAPSLVKGAAVKFRTTADICRELSKHVPEGPDRLSFLRACAGRPGLTPATASSSATHVAIDSETLNIAQKTLALYLGPIAKIMVERSARKARSTSELYEMLAANIPDEKNRRAFLGSAPKQV